MICMLCKNVSDGIAANAVRRVFEDGRIIRLFVFAVNFAGKFIRIYQVFAFLGYNAAV